MRLIPPRKVREAFLLTYELKGCQRAVNLLTEYYGIRRVKIVLDGRRVGNGDEACYENYVAYFTRRGLKKRNVLHELYHHIVEAKGLKMKERIEERQASRYAKAFI